MPESKKNNVAEANSGSDVQPTLKVGNLTAAQKRWLKKGLEQPGGKLPLFDENGREIPARTIRACIDAGWAEPWFSNPIKPDWLVCKLTPAAFDALAARRIRKKS
ncbi:hypothetical protein ABVF61_03680 [Roseibium sp. HPY-6]|uniref:hypothetical protein n=1 Tax=Roseibium sp. HPY-6 TaxID=3229852 RepID=UPI00338EED0E